MKYLLFLFIIFVTTHSTYAENFLSIKAALNIALEAVAEDENFKDKFPVSAKITEPSYPKERYGGKVYTSVWRIDFSTYYPIPPSKPSFVEITHDKKVFVRK